MSVLGEVGHLARPPAAGEPRTGRGNDNLKNFSTLKFLSQGDHCGRNKQRGKVRKAEDNRTRRDRRLQRGLQPPWYVGDRIGKMSNFSCLQLTARSGRGDRGLIALPHAEEAPKVGQGASRAWIPRNN